MNRKEFIRALTILSVAPKTVSEVGVAVPLPEKPIGVMAPIISNIKFLVPDYMPKLMEKYGKDELSSFDDFVSFLEKDKKENPKLYDFKSFKSFDTNNI